MELSWLEDFAALAETGNFSRAAEMRNVTQPAFSRRIRALEEWIGVDLFERAPQGATLTEAGAGFRPGADEAIRRIRQLRADARETGGRDAASLRFAATHALSFTFFSRWMRDLERGTAPLGAIRLVSDSMQACEELMLHGDAQFLICHHHDSAPGRLAPGQFRSASIGGDRLVPFVAPDATGAPKWRLDEGGEVPLLAYSAESGLGRILAAQRFADRGLAAAPLFAAQLAAALMTMARDGRGVAWLPASLAEQDRVAGTLVRAGAESWDVALDIRLFRPRARQSPTAEAFWARAGGGES